MSGIKKKYLILSVISVFSALILTGIFRALTASAYVEIDAQKGMTFYTNSTEAAIPLKNVNENMLAITACADLNGALKLSEKINVNENSTELKINTGKWNENEESKDFYIAFSGIDSDIDESAFTDYIPQEDEFTVVFNEKEYVFKRVTIIFDDIAPQILSVQETVNDDKSVTLSVSAEDEGGAGISKFSFNGGEWIKDNCYTFYGGGLIKIYAMDSAGNVSEEFNYSLDMSAPKLTVSVDGDGICYDGVYEKAVIKVSAEDDCTMPGSFMFSIDNGTSWQNESSFIVDKNGNYTVLAKDESGRTSDSVAEVSIINKAPEIQFENIDKIEGWRNEKSFSFEFYVTDESEIEVKQIKISSDERLVTELNHADNNENKFSVTVELNEDINADEIVSLKTEIDITVTDSFNASKTESVKINMDFESIRVESVDFESDWTNEDVNVVIEASHKASGLKCVKIISGYESEDIYFNGNKAEFKVRCNENEVFSGSINYRILDNAGNSYEDSITVKIDKKKPVISSVNYKVIDENGGNKDSNFIKNGDSLMISVNISEEGSGCRSDKITAYMDENKKAPIMLEPEDNNNAVYTTVIKIDNRKLEWLEDDKSLELKCAEIYDNAGNYNESSLDTASGIRYYAPLEFDSMDFYYRASDNDMLAKDGDIIEIGFVSGHKVNIEDFIGFDKTGARFEWTEKKNNDNRYVYKGKYTVRNSPENDNKYFYSEICLTDDAGNRLMPDISKSLGKILYYAPISDGFSKLSFDSGNTVNKNYARNGNRITISFKTTHPVNVSEEMIAGQNVKFSSKDKMHWKASYKIEQGDVEDNTDIAFSFKLTDSAGNKEFVVTQDNAADIRYLAPIQINGLKMLSDNEKADFKGAKNGDTITVSFSTNHPVYLTDTTIAGKDAEFHSEDNIKWTANITAESGIAEDMDYISLSFTVNDKAGNNAVKQTEKNLTSNKVQYYAPIAVSDVKIISSNAKDSNKYVKDEDEITVSFISNHEIELLSASVAGQTPEISSYQTDGINRRYELKYTIKNGDIPDQSIIQFRFTAADFANNDPVTVISESFEEINQITYYSPISASASVRSGNRNESYVNNGGRITVSGTANHPVTPRSAVIMGKNAQVLGRNSDRFSVYYDIDENENSMTEGNASFSYTLEDNAGNELRVSSVSDGSSVVYDRTQPVMTAEYDNVSFTNNSVTYKFTFSDTHLSFNDISVKVNGEEQITDNERNSLTGTVFTKEITLDTDNNYRITSSVRDMADNEAFPEIEVKMTIDKTDPEIRTLKINPDTPEIYRSSFSIKEHFEIDEKNLREVICTVTNADGTVDWDINVPVRKDGKNTVYLMAADMAGNISKAVTYDFYIDGTAPKPVVIETKTGKLLNQGEKADFNIEANLKISLEALHIEGISQPDEFTSLYITDLNGNVIADLLQDHEIEKGIYNFELSESGSYTLCAQTKDQVGNTTGIIEYPFVITEKSMLERIIDNKLFAAGIASAGGLCIFGGVYNILFRKRKVD